MIRKSSSRAFIVSLGLMTLLLVGCDLFESTEKKQIKVCLEDIQSSLNDPDSVEIISTRKFKVDDGSYRVELEFTSKNTMGGRVRNEGICGFKMENDIKLNPDDTYNMYRKMVRNLRGSGIKLQ